MTTLAGLIETFEKLWPTSSADEWDRPGLVIGNPTQDISKVTLSVDVTAEVIDEALESGSNLILAHHPMLLRGVHELGEITLKGELVSKAIRGDLAIYAAHTNADIAEVGVSRALARAIGLTRLRVLDPDSGHGIAGEVSETKLVDFARKVASILPSVAQGIKVAGDPERLVTKVGLVAGAGDSFLNAALAVDLDLFITSDLRHHPSQDFKEQSRINSGPALMDVAHWAAEWLWLDEAKAELARHHKDVVFEVSDLRTDPWDFAVMQ